MYNEDTLQTCNVIMENTDKGIDNVNNDRIVHSKKIIPLVKFLLPTLTKSERKVAEYLLNYPEKVVKLTLVDYAEISDSSQASVIRLCKKMGLSGYTELKSTLSQQLGEISASYELTGFEDGSLGSDMIEIMENVFNVNIEILKETFALASDEYNKAFEALCNANQICFFAIGDAMVPCEYAKFKFRRLGYICFVEQDSDIMMINASQMKKGDVAIAISHSGNTRQVVDAMKIAKEAGATTICITKREKSELSVHCDIKLFTATPDISVGQEIVARRSSEHAILEALYFAVLQHDEVKNLKKIKTTSQAMEANKI